MNLSHYHDLTYARFQAVLTEIDMFNDSIYDVSYYTFGCTNYHEVEWLRHKKPDAMKFIENCYNKVVCISAESADQTIPKLCQRTLKYWWSDELTALKNNAIDSNNLWIAAGKPSSGITAENRKRDKYSYKLAIKKQKKNEISGITESLYESLLTKNSTNFWTTWKSKLGSPNSLPKKVNGKGNERDIAEEFAVYFADVCTGNSPDRCKTLKDEFIKLKRNYDRTEGHIEEAISVKLVDTVVNNLKFGKAAGVDQLTAENIKYSHPIIILVLAKIFKLLIMFQYVPDGFGIGVMIPIPKSDVSKDREFTCDYRGISINPIISKICESCLLHIFSRYLTSSDLQFGFKAIRDVIMLYIQCEKR